MSSKMEKLAEVPMFRHLPRKTLERLDRIARERSFKAGDEIMHEGDEGVGFFLISAGKVEVTRGGTHLNSLGPGEFFGEMALLDNHRRSATVRAIEATDTVAMLRSDFLTEVRQNAELAVEMLAYMSRRLREADARLAE